MANLKSLVKDTAIYGLSSIVGRFLNYLMVPLYTYTLKSCADYGIYNDIYAQTALLMVLLTFGMKPTSSALWIRKRATRCACTARRL